MPQTPQDVVDRLLRGQPAERVALHGSPWPETLVKWVGQGYPTRRVHKEPGENRWRPDDGRSETVTEPGEFIEPVAPWVHFGYDMVGIGPWFDPLPILDYDELLEETDAWDVRRDGAGAALKYWKHKSGTPEHIDFRMVTREIWERDYRPHVLEWDPARLDTAEMRRNRATVEGHERWTHYGHLFIWELARKSMGDVTLYENLLLDPGWIHDYNRVYTDLYKCAFTAMIEAAGRPDGIWIYEDMGYKNGLFASPRVLRELVFPYYAELVTFFHDTYDLPVVFHTCGSTVDALPMIAEAGFDALNPMERKAKGNDPFAFAEAYGDRLAFVGGLDARVLETNDRDVIVREVTAYIEGMKSCGARLVFATDHSISPRTDYDSYRCALDAYRACMAY
jgi:uroporphyrinogen decarboxylase